MSPVNKEIHRILNLVLAINERYPASISIDVSDYGTPVQIYQWSGSDGHRSIVKSLQAYGGKAYHADLRKIRHDLEQMLAGAKLPLMQVDEEAA